MKIWLLFASLLFAASFIGLVTAQSGQVYWIEDFNYGSVDAMKSAGWTVGSNPAGVSVGGGGVTLNGKNGDAIIRYHDHFPSEINDWKVESKSMWLGEGHSGNGVYVLTERHSYGFSADGYYDEFAFYRDNKKVLHFGIYQESVNQWMTVALVKQGNTINMYFNGELKNTYEETDTQSSAVIGVDIGSPWLGNAKYDYYMVSAPTGSMPNQPTAEESAFPTSTVLIGGGIAALVVGGVVVYYFFIAGGHAGAASGGGSVIEDPPISPLGGETNQQNPTLHHPVHSPIPPGGTPVDPASTLSTTTTSATEPTHNFTENGEPISPLSGETNKPNPTINEFNTPPPGASQADTLSTTTTSATEPTHNFTEGTNQSAKRRNKQTKPNNKFIRQ